MPANRVRLLHNHSNPTLDTLLVRRTNSLGFEGEEPTQSADSVLSLLTIGGSTTEEWYLSEGETWTDVLGRALKRTFAPVWINNAGISGHSTFGHGILMDTVVRMQVKPKVVLFLIGVNDYRLR